MHEIVKGSPACIVSPISVSPLAWRLGGLAAWRLGGLAACRIRIAITSRWACVTPAAQGNHRLYAMDRPCQKGARRRCGIRGRKVGKMYAYGRDAPHDVPEAMRWLSRGVDLGSNEARRELGLLLLGAKARKKIPNMRHRCFGKPLTPAMRRPRQLLCDHDRDRRFL
jgi:hypothetical protein